MIPVENLPTLNALLNGVAFLLLITGYTMIRLGRATAHKRCMIAAFFVSVAFLASYVSYHVLGSEKRFTGTGWIRPVYFAILISHVLLAATVPILASWTLYLGLKERWERHRRLASITFPIWAYVSMTGVLIYLLLFRLYGGTAEPS